MKKNFDDCLELIESPKIRKFVEAILKAAPKEFWNAPCSSSGKYHPPEDQIEGGIIVHSRKAVQVAISLCHFFDIKNQLVKDKIIAACILHDIQKNGIPWGEKTDSEHGLIAGRWLILNSALEPEAQKEDLIHIDGDIMDIIGLVKNHMAIWNCPEPTPALKANQNIAPKNIWHLIVQLADYWASRKWCSFVCDEIEVK